MTQPKNLHTGQIHCIGVTPEPDFWVSTPPPSMAIYVFGTQFAVASPNANILIGNAENFRPGLAFDMNSYPIAGKFFPDFLYIHNNEIWFTSCYQENESASKTYNIYKYSMDDDKFMNTDFVLHPCVNMTVSPKNQLHENFFLSRDGVLRSPPCDGACDYDKKYGWLSSWYNDDSLLNYSYADSDKIKQSKQSHAIFRYKEYTENHRIILNNKQRLTNGYNALWGFDGNVYFVRDGAELWCYNMKKQEASIIYKPSSNKTWSLRPMMSRDRTFLALPCNTGKKMSYILFDLKNKECMNAGNLRNFTWTDNQLTVKWEDL